MTMEASIRFVKIVTEVIIANVRLDSSFRWTIIIPAKIRFLHSSLLKLLLCTNKKDAFLCETLGWKTCKLLPWCRIVFLLLKS